MLRPEEYLKDYAKAVEVWPVSDLISGTTVEAAFNSNHDATATNLTLQNDNINVDCDDRLAPYFDGTSDIALPHTALCADDTFNVLEGGFFAAAKTSAWLGTDINDRLRIMSFIQNANSQMDIQIDENGKLWSRWIGEGVVHETPRFDAEFTDTFSVALTWSQSQNFVKFYINGELVDTANYVAWYLVNGHPSGFTMNSMEIGAVRRLGTPYTTKQQWIGNIVYPTLFAVDVPSDEVIANIHATLID